MPEQYVPNDLDNRTFQAQIARLIDDLNRPDLQGQAINYLQDAMRFFARKPFFFNNVDNSLVPGWLANTYFPFGATIQVPISGAIYAFVQTANPPFGQVTVPQTGATLPAWPTTQFTVPTPNGNGPPIYPPPGLPVAGAVQDGGCIWVNAGNYLQFNTTALSTVYNWNQYRPPYDYVAPYLIEVTWSGNIRQRLEKVAYEVLRGYDTIRPSPPYSYPTMWAWFQQQIYLWPYPNSFYPLTISYRAAAPVVTNPSVSNYWTTIAERLIRKYAQAAIERELIYDNEAAQLSDRAVADELNALRSQTIQTNSTAPGGIPPSSW